MSAVTTLQRSLGRINLLLLLVLAGTGMYVAIFYRVDPIDSYGSALRIQNAVYLGQLARGLHWHCSNILMVTGFLHVLSLALPVEELPELPGRSLVILGILLPAAVSGAVLPWDNAAYWGTQRFLFLIGTIPGLGPLLLGEGTPVVSAGFLRGAWQFHVFVLPTLMALMAYYYSGGRSDRNAPPA